MTSQHLCEIHYQNQIISESRHHEGDTAESDRKLLC